MLDVLNRDSLINDLNQLATVTLPEMKDKLATQLTNAKDAQQRMDQLKEEVNLDIDEFLKTSEAIKSETAEKQKMLKKLKKKFKHIKHKHEKLQHKLQKKAEDEALVEATEQFEM